MSRIYASVLFAALVMIIGFYAYSYNRTNGGEHQENAAQPCGTVSSDSSAKSDSIPDAFATMFTHSYSFDTIHAISDRLPADTFYVAQQKPIDRTGRKISISICGVDSRLGEHVEHADANHILVLWLDSGRIDVISIPRDTPYDAGYAGASHYNILANVRARKGRDAYLKAVADIAGLDTVEYYMDLGFSQARGLLELLGFHNDASDALRILRSRQAFASGDFQRCFNQGQFIRQNIISKFTLLHSLTGELLLRAGVCLVSTNLTVDRIKGLYGQLEAGGFSSRSDNISVSIKPDYYAKMAVFNFSDSVVLGSLLKRINAKADKLGISSNHADSVTTILQQRLEKMLAHAATDSARKPLRVIAWLQRPFEQRIWWQMSDRTERAKIRNTMGLLLQAAYTKVGKIERAQQTEEILRFEEQMFPS